MLPTQIKWMCGLLVFSFFGIFENAVSAEKHDKNEYPPGFYADDQLPDHTVYLTFDDGPSDWTNEILDNLKQNNIKATFFICANWQPKSTALKNSFIKYKDTLERMIAEGHVLGNHSANHLNLAALSAQKIERQFSLNQEMLNEALGSKAPQMTLLRPPFGHPWSVETSPKEKARVANALKPHGLIMMWSKHFNSRDSKEWVKGEWYEKGKRIDVDDKEFKKKMLGIYSRLINLSKGKGMVILFHDTHLTSVKILPELIKKLTSEGYHFATLEEYVQWKWKTDSKSLLLLNNNPENNPEKISNNKK